MNLSIKVTEDFIEQREQRLPRYNKKLNWDDPKEVAAARMRIDCELYEWHLINTNEAEDHDDWRVDAILNGNAIDVKFIEKWYNISNYKLLNILKQRDTIHGYTFMEWVDRPNRPLEVGDEPTIAHVRYIKYEQLINNLQVGKFGGYYVDVREHTRKLV